MIEYAANVTLVFVFFGNATSSFPRGYLQHLGQVGPVSSCTCDDTTLACRWFRPCYYTPSLHDWLTYDRMNTPLMFMFNTVSPPGECVFLDGWMDDGDCAGAISQVCKLNHIYLAQGRAHFALTGYEKLPTIRALIQGDKEQKKALHAQFKLFFWHRVFRGLCPCVDPPPTPVHFQRERVWITAPEVPGGLAYTYTGLGVTNLWQFLAKLDRSCGRPPDTVERFIIPCAH